MEWLAGFFSGIIYFVGRTFSSLTFFTVLGIYFIMVSHVFTQTRILLCWKQEQFEITPVFKKRPNFLNSAPTSIEGALRLLSAPSGRFWQQTATCPVSLWALVVELHPLNGARAQAVRRISDEQLFKKFGRFEHAEIRENAIRELPAFTESAFQEAFQQWKKRWERCIARRGD